ncbi:hypothetical protein GPA10_06770 [Streptomyces sp. p1417]|uniref:Uncharacterized protein n=1 Tax=Streptomyces typhae TaxID=2681492 RepID=A0A6L6WQE1_9ACTN|nr:hypothetical protein [Streptomyces typhae]
MTVAHEEPYDPVDALTRAVTDEPVPAANRADERFMAEYAAAVADVAVLRDQLRIVGDTLARGAPGAEPAASPRPARPALPSPLPAPSRAGAPARSRPPGRPPRAARRGAVLALAAALGAGLLGGVVWLGVRSGTGDDDMTSGAADAKGSAPSRAHDRPGHAAEGAKRSPEGYVACSRLIAEGTVQSVELLPDGTQDRITLDVSRYYKPAEGKEQVTFVMDVSVDPRLRTGDRVLVAIPEGEASPDLWSTGARLAEDRAWIEKALPRARGTQC